MSRFLTAQMLLSQQPVKLRDMRWSANNLAQ